MKVHNLVVTGSLTSGGENIGSISSSVAITNNAQDGRLTSLESTAGSITSKTGSYSTTGSNVFVGNQTISGSIIPAVNGVYDLGSSTHEFRHLYLSSASLYIDGTKVLGSTTQELQITTDTGQSFKILEAGADTITLQSADGNITLATSGGGDVILDPTTGIIALKGSTQVYAGNRILSSDGNNIHFGNGVTISGSLLATGTNIISGSQQISDFGYTTTSSVNTISSSINTRINSISNIQATTGSNNFVGTQTITGSLYISQNLIVQGSSSLQDVTGSNVYIGTNKVNLNTNTPSVRFGGISVFDSGSNFGESGSLLWDSQNNRWLYQHPASSGAPYKTAIIIAGPQNSGSIGNETTLTSGKISKAVGDDHIGDSIMTETGGGIGINGDLSITGSLHSAGTNYLGGGGFYASTDQSFSTDRSYSFRDGVGISNPNGLSYATGTTVVSIGNMSNGVSLITTGNVGIGKNSANTPLDVNGNTLITGSITSVGSSPLLKFINTSAGAGAGSIQFYSSSAQIWNLGTHTNNDMYLYNNTTGTYNYWIQNSTGYIGVNTNNPSRQLHVVDGTSATIAATKTGTDSSQIGVDSVSYIGAGGDLTFRAGGFVSGSEKARLTTGGYFGLGTNNPSYLLHVKSSIAYIMAESTSGGDAIITAKGATTDLHGMVKAISQNGTVSTQLISTRSSVDGNLPASVSGVWTTTNHPLVFGTNNTEYVRLTAAGRLGIGTNNPGNTLHVYGGGILIENNQDFRTKNSSGTQRTLVYMNSSNKVLLVNDDGDIILSATGSVGSGTSTPLSMMNNKGMQISRGGHTTLMIGDGTSYGGVIQSSDDLRRMFIGANVYDDVTNSWQQFSDTYGFAAFDAISNNTDGGMARILVGSGNDSSYAGTNIFFEAYKSNSNSYVKLRTTTADNSIYISNGGNVSLSTTNNYGNLTIGNTYESRKITIDGTYGIKRNVLFKDFDVSGNDITWHRISLSNNYATDNQGVFLLVTVGYHPMHASQARFYQYRVFQSPYTTDNSYMMVQTVFETNLGWNYYSFSSEVQFYNYQGYLYIKLVGQNASYNRRRSILVESVGGSYATDNMILEVNVSAPASTSGVITKNASESLSG